MPPLSRQLACGGARRNGLSAYRFLRRAAGLAALMLLLASCSAGGSSAQAELATIEYGLAGGSWDYTAEIPGEDLDRLATAVASWNFIRLPLSSQFSGPRRVHEARFADGPAWRLGLPRQASDAEKSPDNWDQIKATASVTEGSLVSVGNSVQMYFALGEDAPELAHAVSIGINLTGVTITASFDKPEAERLIRMQKDSWNAWYTGELSRAQGGQLAGQVSAETIPVDWTVSGLLEGKPFSTSFVQHNQVFSDIVK